MDARGVPAPARPRPRRVALARGGVRGVPAVSVQVPPRQRRRGRIRRGAERNSARPLETPETLLGRVPARGTPGRVRESVGGLRPRRRREPRGAQGPDGSVAVANERRAAVRGQRALRDRPRGAHDRGDAAVRAIDGGTKKSGEEPEAQGADESQAGELRRRDAEAAVGGGGGDGTRGEED